MKNWPEENSTHVLATSRVYQFILSETRNQVMQQDLWLESTLILTKVNVHTYIMAHFLSN